MPKGEKQNIVAKPDILAVAFTDVNGNDKYDGKDKLIAAVVDTNHDETVSPNDTIQFGTYPLDVDGAPQISMQLLDVHTLEQVEDLVFVGFTVEANNEPLRPGDQPFLDLFIGVGRLGFSATSSGINFSPS